MNIKVLQQKYKKSKSAKVGDKCICPSCDAEFIKTNYQQAFCKTKSGTTCKDFYWNNVTPSKRNNTERISPANRARLSIYSMRGFENYDDDQGWDAHKSY